MVMRFGAAMTACLFIANAALAGDARPLTGPDIIEHLTDRTAIYDDGARQYFATSGWTDYVAGNGPPDRGKWEVRGDEYHSWWERGGWSCYKMRERSGVDGPVLEWKTCSGDAWRYPARMVDGNKTNP